MLKRTGSLTDPFKSRVVDGHAIVLFVVRRRYATSDRGSVCQATGESKMDVRICRECFWINRLLQEVIMVTDNLADSVPEATIGFSGVPCRVDKSALLCGMFDVTKSLIRLW